MTGQEKHYDVWRYFKAAHFESVDDGSLTLHQDVVLQILEATGLKTVKCFNEELVRYRHKSMPSELHERLRGLLDSTTSDDWRLLTLSGRKGPTDYIQIEPPLMLTGDAPAPTIDVYAMAFAAVERGYSFQLSASVNAPKQFKARPGEEEICSLLIESQEKSFDKLLPEQKTLFCEWLLKNRVNPSTLGKAFEEATSEILRASERNGIMSKTFHLGRDRVADYFIECSDGDESGFCQ